VIVAAELSGLGIRIKSGDLILDDIQFSSDFKYANASSFSALGQIKDLLDAYHGQDAIKLFETGYYLELVTLALAYTQGDQRGNDQLCGLWIVYGSKALHAIERLYNLPHIATEECKSEFVAVFRDRLDKEVELIARRLEPRAAPLSR
jgi:hypothetical protein